MQEKALTVIDKPQDLALFQQGYVQEYSYNVEVATSLLDEAEEALALTDTLGLPSQHGHWLNQVGKAKDELGKAKARLAFYSNGFLPLPRMDAVDLKWSNTPMPLEALRRLNEAKELQVFDSFALVERAAMRDPILVGIKQFADGEIVHCFIAWWR